MRGVTSRHRPGFVALIAIIAALATPGPTWALTPTPTPRPIWLDQQPLANWNRAGLPVPTAPPAQGESATSGRCRAPAAPLSAEERAVVAAGWSMYKASDRQQLLTVVHAEVAVDGMCRPWQYQAFVFVGGTFAGTLSPVTMNARSDGALTELTIGPDSGPIAAQYQRYATNDPLCCPSRLSTVTFAVDPRSPLISPTGVVSAPAATPGPGTPSPSPALPNVPNTGSGGGEGGSRWRILPLTIALACWVRVRRARRTPR